MRMKWLLGLGLLVLPIPFLRADTNEVAPGVLQLGTIQNPAITESSGVIPAHRSPGIFWTHNDGGEGVLYGVTADGAPAGQFTVTGAQLDDWEDIAYSLGRIYIADIGNNTGSRSHAHVYAVREPLPGRTGEVSVVKSWTLSYPGDPFNAESLVLARGYGYIIKKESGGAHVFRFKLSGGSDKTLEEQCKLNMSAPAAGADITSDKRLLAVITNEGAYLFAFHGKIPSEGTIDPELFVPFSHDRMEGCCFTRDGLLVTAETREIYLFTDPLFKIRTGVKVLQ